MSAIKIRRSRTAFSRDRRGNVSIIFGLSFLPVMMMMGGTVDYYTAAITASHVQSSLDAAVLQGLGVPAASRSAVAGQVFQNNLDGRYALMSSSSSFETESDGAFTGTGTAQVKTSFLRIMGIDSVTIFKRSKAVALATPVGAGAGCVLSLNDSAVNAIWDNGDARVELPTCDIYTNSGNSVALEVAGNARLHAKKVSVVGGVSGVSKITAHEGIFTGQGRMADPYQSVARPAFSGCAYDGFSTNVTTTLNPGVYCNGLKINSQAVVTMSPGLYVIDRGSFSVDGGATLTGSGVTIVFTSSTGGDWAKATINGGAAVNLSAPAKTATVGVPGVVLYGDRAMATGTEFKLNGGSSQVFKGAIYLPEAKLNYAGGASYTEGCIQIIADTVKFIGNSNVAVNSCGDIQLSSFGAGATATVRKLIL